MLVTNNTSQDIYFGPLRVGAGASNVTIDDTSATSLYLLSDSVADSLNNAYASGKISVSGANPPFPRPTGVPQILHGDGSPEGVVYAPQGSMYMRRDNTGGGTAIYSKTTGVTLDTGWYSANISTTVVANTVAGLGNVTDGTPGLLILGPSHYDFMPVIYSASEGRWTSATQIAVMGGSGGYSINNNTTISTNYSVVQSLAYNAYRYYNAGLKCQYRLIFQASNGSSSFGSIFLDFFWAKLGTAFGVGGTSWSANVNVLNGARIPTSGNMTTSSVWYGDFDETQWRDLPSGLNIVSNVASQIGWRVGVQSNASPANTTTVFSDMTLLFRWVSQ